MKTYFSAASLLIILLASNLVSAELSTQTNRPSSAAQKRKPKKVEEQFSIIIKKSERRLYLYNGEQRLLKTYRIALGPHPIGTKKKQGDGATPEGDYYITHKNPRSNYYLSLGLSYPNIVDADDGLKRRLITKAQHQTITSAIKAQGKPPQNTPLGGDIFIHGGGARSDWTLGCVALENADIKELFDQLPVKTPVKILP